MPYFLIRIFQVLTYASSISGWLHLYPPRDVLTGSYVYSDWRPDLVDRVFHFLVPDNLRVSILTKKAKYFATQVEQKRDSLVNKNNLSDKGKII